MSLEPNPNPTLRGRVVDTTGYARNLRPVWQLKLSHCITRVLLGAAVDVPKVVAPVYHTILARIMVPTRWIVMQPNERGGRYRIVAFIGPAITATGTR